MTRAPTRCRAYFALLALLASFGCWQAHAQLPEAASAPEGAVPAPPPVRALPTLPAAAPISALTAAPVWAAMSPAQQALLAPLARDWDGLDSSHRSKWLNVAIRLSTLPPTEQNRMQERMRDWARLSPAERRDARIGFQVAKQVQADERQAKWEAYQALPPERRQELADKATARRQAQAAAPRTGAPKPLAASPKSNIVPAAPKLVVPVPVATGVVQGKPGASTVLMTRGAVQPRHHAAGEAKVVADPALVDAKTLLPRSLKAPSAASRPNS